MQTSMSKDSIIVIGNRVLLSNSTHPYFNSFNAIYEKMFLKPQTYEMYQDIDPDAPGYNPRISYEALK